MPHPADTIGAIVSLLVRDYGATTGPSVLHTALASLPPGATLEEAANALHGEATTPGTGGGYHLIDACDVDSLAQELASERDYVPPGRRPC